MNDNYENYNDNINSTTPNFSESGEYSYRYTPTYQPAGSNPYTTPPKKQKKGWSGKKTAALALCCAILGGLAGAGGFALISGAASKEDPQHDGQTVVYEAEKDLSAVNTKTVKKGEELTASQLYEANVGSTVGITTQITTNYWGFTSSSAASGSGFIISEDGYIVTNHHVIEDASSVTVSTYDGTGYDAVVVGYDESNDIAILKIDAQGLKPVVLGNSGDMSVGDDVVAIGNPLGELTFSLTKGAVSALNRDITVESGVSMKLIQTDCAINSGNSGGALFNMYGEVIGITNAKYSSDYGSASIDNIGFAIPIDNVKSVIESIIEKGYVSQPYIGVTVQTVSEDAVSYGTPEGAAVKSVTEGGPAAKAGLKENDIITAIDGTEITTSDELVDIVKQAEIGQTVRLKVYRQGEVLEISVTIGEKKSTADSTQTAEEQTQQNGNQYDQYGGQYDQYGGQDGQSSQGWSMFPWGFGGF